MRLDFLRQMNNYLLLESAPTNQNKDYINSYILHAFIKLSFIEQMQSTLLPTNP